MEHFNFLGLPDVVQDLIVHEIVHNSIPNDRIQLARTCKYLNEAVKRAKPKKIVEKVILDLSFLILRFECGLKTLSSSPSPEFYTNICQILQQIQVEELEVETHYLEIEKTQDSKFFHHLFEAAKFVTKLKIYHSNFLDEFAELYNNLDHVEFLDFCGSIDMFNSLSHYPSKMRLSYLFDYYSDILENITKKTVNNPLSSLYLDGCIPIEDLQQFLPKTKFKNGCEIYCKIQNSEGKEIHIFMTFINDEHGFEIETFPEESSLIVADQKCDGKGKRILRLIQFSINFESSQDSESNGIPFDVTMKTQPTLPVFSNYLVDGEQDFVLENIKENDWIKINTDAHVRYSNKMLESNFPRDEFASAHERVTFINATLGCQISIIKAEELAETV